MAPAARPARPPGRPGSPAAGWPGRPAQPPGRPGCMARPPGWPGRPTGLAGPAAQPAQPPGRPSWVDIGKHQYLEIYIPMLWQPEKIVNNVNNTLQHLFNTNEACACFNKGFTDHLQEIHDVAWVWSRAWLAIGPSTSSHLKTS